MHHSWHGVEGSLPSIDKSKLKDTIRRWMRFKMPGLYEALEPVCLRTHKKDCLDLFLDEPDKFRDILVAKFRDNNFIHLIVRYSFIRPLLEEVKKLDLEEKLSNDFINNANKFKQTLEDIIAA